MSTRTFELFGLHDFAALHASVKGFVTSQLFPCNYLTENNFMCLETNCVYTAYKLSCIVAEL